MLNAAQPQQPVRQLVDAFAATLERQNLQAVVVVQMHVHGRDNLVGVVVLHLVQTARQIAGMVVIDHGERTDDLLVGCAHLLLGDRGANQIAYGL